LLPEADVEPAQFFANIQKINEKKKLEWFEFAIENLFFDRIHAERHAVWSMALNDFQTMSF